MDRSYWYRRMSFTRYRFVRVSRATGDEVGEIPALSGGTITRNDDTRIKEGAEASLVDDCDFGPDLVRVYLMGEWADGTTADVVLGTFVPVVPSRSITAGHSTYSLKMYGRLQELLDDKFAAPVMVEPGSNAVAVARAVCEAQGLTVVVDPSDYVTTNARSYGVGARQNNSEVGDTKLDMVNDLLSLAGFRAATTDEMGRVLMRRYADPSSMAESWRFSEGPTAKFESDMTEERDYTTAANHVVVRYGTFGDDGTGSVVVGEAYDTDPGSDLSTVSRGRVITSSYEYDELPPGSDAGEMQAYADRRAETLLATAQSIVRRVTLTHAYAPVAVNDVVAIDYPSGGVSGRFQVRTQTMRLAGGCPTECEARIFRRRRS